VNNKVKAIFYIDSGKRVFSDAYEIVVGVPKEGKKSFEIGTYPEFDRVIYTYVRKLDCLMQEISEKKKRVEGDYRITAIVDIKRKVIQDIINIE
jgi:hypothetical protein